MKDLCILIIPCLSSVHEILREYVYERHIELNLYYLCYILGSQCISDWQKSILNGRHYAFVQLISILCVTSKQYVFQILTAA